MCINANAIKEVNKPFYSFPWNGKGDKIKRNVIINDYPNGGLKMTDIDSFSKSLKATWINKYLDEYLELESLDAKTVLTGNLNMKDTKNLLKTKDKFIN